MRLIPILTAVTIGLFATVAVAPKSRPRQRSPGRFKDRRQARAGGPRRSKEGQHLRSGRRPAS